MDFFTGENGTGKTSLLRALTACICGLKVDENLGGSTSFTVNLYTPSLGVREYSRQNNKINHHHSFPIIQGFAAYGPARLKLKGSNPDLKNDFSSSIFGEESNLIDLQDELDNWKKSQPEILEKRRFYITEVLTDLIPQLYNITFYDMIDGDPCTTFGEKDSFDGTFNKVPFRKLASGMKSLVATFGDILIRLFHQQPEVNDPSEFTGIIIIDEIDIHLHPKLQRRIVEQLTITFPKIQFIVSTHSPIPFLGAPPNSQIYNIKRNTKDGVTISRLDSHIDLGTLLPNTILSSPIFGLDDIVPKSHTKDKLLRSEDTFEEMEFNQKIERIINEFITDSKEKQLINLFKSRK